MISKWVRAHLLLSAAVVSLALAGIAAAVIFVYDPVSSGSANGSFGQHTTHVNAITFSTGTGSSTAVVPCASGSGANCTGGTPGVIPVAITNNDPNVAHAATGLSVTLASPGNAGCTPHLFYVSGSNLTEAVAAGATEQNGSVTFVADPSTPVSCDGDPITATISGTST